MDITTIQKNTTKKHMKNKTKQQILAEMLQKELNSTEQMWDEGKSPAFIAGYLKGLIKVTISELK